MTDVLEVVSRLEEAGGKLTLHGDRIHYFVPNGDAEAQGLLAELRNHRERVRVLLLERTLKKGSWSPPSLEAERFRHPHAKLFRFLGRKVRTPAGLGTLLQVFAERVTVLLDSELSRCSFFPPTDIEPISWDLP